MGEILEVDQHFLFPFNREQITLVLGNRKI